jgi:hemolysin activation/secretion protein
MGLATPLSSLAQPLSLPDEQPCFVVEHIRLVGPKSGRFHWLAVATESVRGACVGPLGVASIARYLDAQLIEQGYVTSRVSIAPQRLNDGELAITLHVGTLASIRLIDASTRQSDERWGTWANAFPTQVGQPLNVRDLEQGVEQMQRLPSQTVTTTLEPGDEPDTTALSIARQAGGLSDRVRGGVTLDNSGTAALGRLQATLAASLDNPFAINDIASISLGGNAAQPSADHRSQNAAFNYSVPFGYGLLGLSLSHSRFGQNVPLTTTQVLSRGESDVAAIRWDHVVLRTASAKARLFSELSTRDASSSLDDLELPSSKRRTTFIEIGANFRQVYGGGANIDLSLSRKQGESWVAAQDDLPAEAGGATLRPRLWLWSASIGVPFTVAAQPRSYRYETSLRGQATANETTVNDQFAIGGRGTVRGFDGNSILMAENGWTWRNQVATPVDLQGLPGSVYVALDVGRVWGPSDQFLVGHKLVGAAVGLRGQWQALQFDIALAAPVAKPEGCRTAKLSAYLSATYAF